jgi:FkbM family methyltransferase
MGSSLSTCVPPVTPGEFNVACLPTLLGTHAPTIFEIGCHNGYHTSQFLRLFPKGRIFAFEPDERAQQAFRRNVTDPRAVLFRVAIGANDGSASFFRSSGVNPAIDPQLQADWDHSGSIRRPTGHLLQHPWCTFIDPHPVRVRMLDTVAEELGVEIIDFLWADVQGAEADLIRGGHAALARTRYIHTEYSDIELYEGQKGLGALLELLPGFRVLVRWQNDVLLWNSAFSPPPSSLVGGNACGVPQSPSQPHPPYVLARPRTGLNDTLCELEKCLRYCEAVGRHLIVDTTRSGIYEHLDVYLETREPASMTLRCVDDDVYRLNALACIPHEIAGRLDSYTASCDPQAGTWVESISKAPLTFDFARKYAEPLLVHEQHWTGPLLSPAFLARCRLQHEIATEVARRLAAAPAREYVAIHIRNTDYTTNYPEFFEQIRARVAGCAVLVCTDDSRAFEYALTALPTSRVFRLSTFVNDSGRPLHGVRRRDQHDMNLQLFTDLMGMAFSREILAAPVQQIPRLSGFTLLAMALHHERNVARELLRGIGTHCSVA